MGKKPENPDNATPSPGLAPRFAGSIALVVATATAVLLAFGAPLHRNLGRAFEFRTRDLLSRGPNVAESLKVYAYDDEAAAMRGGTEPGPLDWAQIIAELAKREPRAILIDRAFAHQVAPVLGRRFVETLAESSTPLSGKALISPTELMHLSPLPTQRFAFGFPRLSPSGSKTSFDRTRRPPPWLATPVVKAYGPGEPMAIAFQHMGHGLPLESGGIKPFVSLAETALLPHWTLLAGGEPRLERGQLVLNGANVDLDEDDAVPVNLIAAEVAQNRIVSLAAFFKDDASRERSVAWVKPGDTVMILTDLRQAQTPYEATSLGRMPAAFVDMALASSALTGRWFTVLPGRGLLSFFLCFVAAYLATRLDRRRLWAATFGGTLLLIVLGNVSFSAFGIMVPWFSPGFAFLVTGVGCALAAARKDQTRLALLRHDLDGRISPDKLQAMLERDALTRLDASEQVVTMMFIDIVGFSRAADRQTPKEAFSSLKSLIDQMRTAVYDYGGVVDRTMGDGMLCVFGFDLQKRSTNEEDAHQAGRAAALAATQAVECAARIQRDNMHRMLRAQKTHEAVFPLRVGVNTAGVYVGNLGDSDKVDLTVIGSGVNFAQRLEAACDRHMVMLGAATRDLVQNVESVGSGLRKRHIRVKHSTELVEAYEFDPFHTQAQLLLEGDEAYRVLVGIERSDMRWPVPDPSLIQVSTSFGEAEMINFSLDGFTIRLNDYYAKDVALTLRLDTPDRELGLRLERAGLDSIMLEVRWARPDGNSYVHGCQIKSLSKDQRSDVISMLRDIVQRHALDLRRDVKSVA